MASANHWSYEEPSTAGTEIETIQPNRFEWLSPELLEAIFLFLNGKDLASMASTCKRHKAIVGDSNKLLLKLNTQLSFVRAVRMTRNFIQRDIRVGTSFFRFMPPEIPARKNYLVELARKIPAGRTLGGYGYFILVLASNVDEADHFYRTLLDNDFEARMALSYISREAWADLKAIKKKVFLVTLKVAIDFEMPCLSAVIDFRNPRDLGDYLEVQSINPRRSYQIFTPNQDNFNIWYDIFHHLLRYSSWPHSPSVQYDSPLEIDRTFYQARARNNAGPVFQLFG